jgi:hypothetical protein
MAMRIKMICQCGKLQYGVECAISVKMKGGDNGNTAADALDFHLHMPTYYIDDNTRNSRHQIWLDIVKEDEERFNRTYCNR